MSQATPSHQREADECPLCEHPDVILIGPLEDILQAQRDGQVLPADMIASLSPSPSELEYLRDLDAGRLADVLASTAWTDFHLYACNALKGITRAE